MALEKLLFSATCRFICSINLPCLALSVLYRNRMAWCSTSILSTASLSWAFFGSVMPYSFSTAFASSSHLPNFIPNSLHTFLIAMYWSLNSCMSWNFSWFSIIRFMCAIAFLCCTFRLLVPLVYTSFLISFSRPIESSDISKLMYLVLALTWFLVSESHSDINTANRLHKLPSSTLSVFIGSPMQYSHTLSCEQYDSLQDPEPPAWQSFPALGTSSCWIHSWTYIQTQSF